MRAVPQLRGPLFSSPALATDPFAVDFLPIFGQQQPRVPKRAQRRQRDQFPAPGVGPQQTASQYFNHAAGLRVVLQVSLHSAVHSVHHFSALRSHCAVHSRSLRQFLPGPRKLEGSRVIFLFLIYSRGLNLFITQALARLILVFIHSRKLTGFFPFGEINNVR